MVLHYTRLDGLARNKHTYASSNEALARDIALRAKGMIYHHNTFMVQAAAYIITFNSKLRFIRKDCFQNKSKFITEDHFVKHANITIH